MKIVIIDDDPDCLALARTALQHLNKCQVIDFSLPNEALAWCVHNNPDLVIVDYMMPKLDGMAFIRRFRALEGKANIPILMTTAQQESRVRYHALAFGAAGLIIKPLDANKLYAPIKKHLPTLLID